MLLKLSPFVCFLASTIVSSSRAQKDGLSFFFWGDTGGNNPANESQSGVAYEGAKVADAISYYATEVNPDFMVLLGDNFHPRGVQNTTDPVSPLYHPWRHTLAHWEKPDISLLIMHLLFL